MQKLTWQTASGKRLAFDDIPHDHLSNIYHYSKLFSFQPAMHPSLKKLLNEKYKGEVLPYDPKYYFEVEELEKLGYLQMKNNVCLIVFEGQKIGIVRNELLKGRLCLLES